MTVKVDFKIEGLEELKDLFKQMSKCPFEEIKGLIYNDVKYAWVLEYGSEPGKKPWPTPGEKTTFGADPDSGEMKIVSSQGFAMLRTAFDDAQKIMVKKLSKIRLDQPLRPQIEGAIDNSGMYLKRQAMIGTPFQSLF